MQKHYDYEAVQSSDKQICLSLEQALDLYSVSWFQYNLLFMCGLSFMADALQISLLTFLTPCVKEEWNLTPPEEASITGVMFIGTMLGNLCWGLLADRFGRRPAYLISTALVSFGCLSLSVVPSFFWMIIVLCIAGFGIGGSSIPFDLLAEMIPADRRGAYLIYIELFWTFGSMFIAGLAWISLHFLGWRFLASMSSLPVSIALIYALLYLPESPRWLLIKGRVVEAVEVIQGMGKMNGIIIPKFSLTTQKTVKEEKKPNFSDLLNTPDARSLSIPLWTLWFIFGVSYYGFVMLTSRIYAKKTVENSGGIEVSFNFPVLFLSASSELIGLILAAFSIDYMGRVNTQIMFYLVGAVAVVLMSVGFFEDLTFLASVVGRMSIMAATCVTWVITPELYTTELRTIGHSSCAAISRIGCFLAPYLVFSDLEPLYIGLLLGLLNLIATGASYLLPETAGKALDGIKD